MGCSESHHLLAERRAEEQVMTLIMKMMLMMNMIMMINTMMTNMMLMNLKTGGKSKLPKTQ